MTGIQVNQQEFKDKQLSMTKREELARYASRKWKVGDVYSPHDLSPSEMLEWSEPQRPTKDIIDILGINPLDHYKVGENDFYLTCFGGTSTCHVLVRGKGPGRNRAGYQVKEKKGGEQRGGGL